MMKELDFGFIKTCLKVYHLKDSSPEASVRTFWSRKDAGERVVEYSRS